MSKKVGEKFGGASKKGEGVGRKGVTCSQSQTFYQTLFAHEWGAIVQFDWLLVHHQNMTPEIFLSCIIPHPEHNKIKIDMAEYEEVFDGVFKFSVQETSNDLSQNGNSSF